MTTHAQTHKACSIEDQRLRFYTLEPPHTSFLSEKGCNRSTEMADVGAIEEAVRVWDWALADLARVLRLKQITAQQSTICVGSAGTGLFC